MIHEHGVDVPPFAGVLGNGEPAGGFFDNEQGVVLVQDFESRGQGGKFLDRLLLWFDGDFVAWLLGVVELRDGAGVHLHGAVLEPLADLGLFDLGKGFK